MAANLSVHELQRILDRVPGAIFAIRSDPATGARQWLYGSPALSEVYGVEGGDEGAMLSRVVDEQRGSFERALDRSRRTLAPVSWVGRMTVASGEPRGVEVRHRSELSEDGSVLTCSVVSDAAAERGRVAADAERAHEQTETLYRTVFDALPVAVVVMNADGTLPVFNAVSRALAGSIDAVEPGEISSRFGLYRTDGTTPFPNDELPLSRALRGEETSNVEMIMRHGSGGRDLWLDCGARPIRDASGAVVAAMSCFQDVTAQRTLERELRTRNEQLSASEEVKSELVERLRYAIDELSNPILEVWDDVLVLPIIGVVDSRRTADMVQRLLAEVTRTQAAFVIVDLTGVEVVDTKTADHLMKLVRKVEMVGARCVLTGIRPAVSETLVDIGVDLGRLTTLRNLKHGLREALRATRRQREESRLLDDGELLDTASPAPRPR